MIQLQIKHKPPAFVAHGVGHAVELVDDPVVVRVGTELDAALDAALDAELDTELDVEPAAGPDVGPEAVDEEDPSIPWESLALLLVSGAAADVVLGIAADATFGVQVMTAVAVDFITASEDVETPKLASHD